MDLDYCFLMIVECWLLSSLKRAWLMIPSMEEILHQLTWRFFLSLLGKSYIYINWYRIVSINSFSWTSIFRLKVIDANLHSRSLVPWPVSIPPLTHQCWLPCLPWHKMAHGDDIGPHLLNQPNLEWQIFLFHQALRPLSVTIDFISPKKRWLPSHGMLWDSHVIKSSRLFQMDSCFPMFCGMFGVYFDKSHQNSSQCRPIRCQVLRTHQNKKWSILCFQTPSPKTHTFAFPDDQHTKHPKTSWWQPFSF